MIVHCLCVECPRAPEHAMSNDNIGIVIENRESIRSQDLLRTREMLCFSKRGRVTSRCCDSLARSMYSHVVRQHGPVVLISSSFQCEISKYDFSCTSKYMLEA